MRYRDILTEAKDSVYHNPWTDKPVSIYRNPTRGEITNMLRRAAYGRRLRGVIWGNDVYLWDGGQATHFEIARHLGIGLIDCLPIELRDDGVWYLHNTMLHREVDPEEVVRRMQAMPSFRGWHVGSEEWRNAR